MKGFGMSASRIAAFALIMSLVGLAVAADDKKPTDNKKSTDAKAADWSGWLKHSTLFGEPQGKGRDVLLLRGKSARVGIAIGDPRAQFLQG